MADFVLMTDSACDLPLALLDERDIPCVDLTFTFEGDATEYQNRQMPIAEFYQRMRDGQVAKTSAVNVGTLQEAFRPHVEAGKDVVFIGFSSGLSVTTENARSAADALMAEYPGRRIAVVDTLCASAGEGMVVLLADNLRKAGGSFDEVVAKATEAAPQVCHWFTVDDLVYLERGGRVSKVAAMAGQMLNIKPVLHVADDGKLYNVSKTRGRKRSVVELFNHMMDTADPQTKGFYLISNADCMDDAEALEELIFQQTGTRAQVITSVGPVIGAHSGPGTLALFFLGGPR